MLVKNIIVNSFKSGNLSIVINKLFKLFERTQRDEALLWARAQTKTTTEKFCEAIDAKLFQEVKKDIFQIEQRSKQKLDSVKGKLGGGANYVLLYFLVRKLKSRNVVETGVAAGWTTIAILEALEKNGYGALYSSDLPYFRLKNPEQYIGCLVQDSYLKERWHLDIRGDRIALCDIRKKLDDAIIDIFHYDSDKSYSGRMFALEILSQNLSAESIIIFDDIQDNLHFRDWVEGNNFHYTVLEFEGKYLGIVGI